MGTILEDTQDVNINPDDPNQLDNNNYKARPITILLSSPPDLVVTSVVPTTQAPAGGAFDVTWSVQNQGADETKTSNWIDNVYLSDSPTLDTSGAKKWLLGRVAHNGSLAVGARYTSTLNTILSPAAAGKYVIVETNAARIDGGSRAWEGAYTNNNTRNATTDATNAPADLVVTQVTAPAENFSGESAKIKWTVQNVGGAVWSGTKYWYDEVWFSPDPTFIPERATKVGFFPHSQQQPLAAGESYTQEQEITLPRGINGNYYIYVSTDYSYDRYTTQFRGEIPANSGDNDSNRNSFEYRVFENPNNLGTTTIPVTYREPDLRGTNLIVPPTSPFSGETIGVTWTVTNTGTRDTRENV